ncbi:MAG: DUF3501 family protein [Gammaproteobacteria bacterium]|uniref:DUF3501 family protein n=1 Tax=Pseudomaricurvus alcaniphilus TaxID=1166482 RepID=UPI00140C8690|nr:DUF3501 family protein [Pseudomaricurvus alcaniphilus]MBR9911188.1 DUF3501 family protein [Gammaproteobacteria bacterium]NHN36331.1 DUF3501 family protein [Pseudomaricurvus alcaniphilus]
MSSSKSSPNKLNRNDLWSLEQYAEKRNEFRQQVMQHKRIRQVALGPNARLHFEDQTTIRYQVQEMLRIERIFEANGIQEELDAYNPLIPDGSNFKATFMLEYDDPVERKTMLAKLRGVEDQVWVKASGCEPVFAIADEDMERDNEEKTSSVHFLRFELPADTIQALHNGADLTIGIDNPHLEARSVTVAKAIRDSLCADLDAVH